MIHDVFVMGALLWSHIGIVELNGGLDPAEELLAGWNPPGFEVG